MTNLTTQPVYDRSGYPLHACQCDNCGHEETIPGYALGYIPNLVQRLDPGGETPAGECSKCGALTYLEKGSQP